MQLPKRDDWVRMGYAALGGGGAIIWNKYLPLKAGGGGYIPPAALAVLVLMSEDSGQIEKDIAAGILGYTASAQAISFVSKATPEADVLIQVGNPAPAAGVDLDAEAAKLQKIRAVTGTLGALADIVGRFRGSDQ